MAEEKITTDIVIRGEKEIKHLGWSILATSKNDEGRNRIRKILEDFNLSGILYHPNLLIEKGGMKFFIIFSEKEKFPISTKKGEERIVSGIDWFKFKLAEYVETITGIQVGLMMYNKEQSILVMRQMNQLEKPIHWFKGDGCLLSAINYQVRKPTEKKQNRLEKIFHDPELTEQENLEIEKIKSKKIPLPILECMKCNEQFPGLCYRCIKGKHKKVRAMAIWQVDEFEQKKLTIQPQLQLKK